MTEAPYIDVSHLSKHYIRRNRTDTKGLSRLFRREKQEIAALDDATFSIARGEVAGLIGPNGAGKSTTVKLLTGILTPTGGKVTIDGRTPHLERQAHVRTIGVVFGQRTQLWWDVPIGDSFTLLRDVYDLEDTAYRRRLDELVTALDLSAILKTPLRQLSLGQRMRAELCGSLLHEPRLLFLDEPTIGLDAVSKLKLRSFLQEENKKRGTTILITTHDMEDMLALCKRVMVLGHGRLLYDGSLDALLKRYDTVHTIRLSYEGTPNMTLLPKGASAAADGSDVIITYAPKDISTGDMLSALLQMGRIREMTLKEQNVDTLIARMYEEMAL